MTLDQQATEVLYAYTKAKLGFNEAMRQGVINEIGENLIELNIQWNAIYHLADQAKTDENLIFNIVYTLIDNEMSQLSDKCRSSKIMGVV